MDITDINTILSDSGPMALDQTLVGTDLEINHIAGNRDTVYSHVCYSHELFRADIYPTVKTYDLHIWTVRESDDDEINFCQDNRYLKKNCIDSIESAEHQCLLPGADLTFDMYLSVNQPWLKPMKDSILYPQTTVTKVLAGKDKRCDSDIMKSSNLENGPSFDMQKLIDDTNQILGKAGISINFIDHGEIHLNFDIKKEDNKADEDEGFDALSKAILLEGATGTPIPANSAKVMLFSDLEDPVNTSPGGGTSTRFGVSRVGQYKTLLDGNIFHERTLAHELGHAIWSLQHPDELTPMNNPIQVDKLLQIVTNDSANLMTSGSKAGSNVNVNNSFLRKYVWRIMQDGR